MTSASLLSVDDFYWPFDVSQIVWIVLVLLIQFIRSTDRSLSASGHDIEIIDGIT